MSNASRDAVDGVKPEPMDDDDLGQGPCSEALAAEELRLEHELRESMLPLDGDFCTGGDDGSNSMSHARASPSNENRPRTRDTSMFGALAHHLPLAPPQQGAVKSEAARATPMALADTKPVVQEHAPPEPLPFVPAAAFPLSIKPEPAQPPPPQAPFSPTAYGLPVKSEPAPPPPVQPLPLAPAAAYGLGVKPESEVKEERRGLKRQVKDESAIVIDSDSEGAAPSSAPPAAARRPRSEAGNGSAGAPIAIDSDDELPRQPPRAAGNMPIYLGAIPAIVPFKPTALPIRPALVAAATRLTLIRESRAVPHSNTLELLIRVLLPAAPGAEPVELGRLDWGQARFLWTLSAREKILVQCIARDQRMLSVPHADTLPVALMLYLDPRAARWQDAGLIQDIPLKRKVRAEHEQESAAWRDLFEQLFAGPAPNVRRVRDGSTPAVVSFDLGRFCQGDLGGVSLPETDPAPTMRLTLYAHQRQALSWMLSREREPLLVPNPLFSEYRAVDDSQRAFWFNPTTAQVMFTPPSPLMMPRGGILADEMGLGKTISTIALIATNPPTKAWLQPEPPLASNAPIRSRATLVVCPLSMLNTWRDEVVRALADEPNKPRVRLFYGPQRISDPTDLANSDVVITTYSTIVSELKMHLASQPDAAAPPLGQSPPPAPRRGKGESPLFAIEWWRIALDEAHTVRCKKTQSATAVFKLQACSRWCLTGTPIHNSLDDLFSLLHFLNTPVYGQEAFWMQLVSRPFQRKDKESLVRLNSVLQALMLRRMKTDSRGSGPLVQLPPKTVEIAYLDFSPSEAAAYKALSDASRERFRRLERENAVLANYANVLEMLLRLRQLCDHPALLPNGYLTRPGAQAAVAPISPELRAQLLDLASKSSVQQFGTTVASVLSGTMQECVRCKDAADRPQLLPCGHVSCAECIADGSAWDSGMATCALCKAEVSARDVVALPFVTAEELQSELCGADSTKLVALLRELGELPHDCKAVVFSQWTSMMDLIGTALDRAGTRFARLDGSMPLVRRQRALDDFAKVPHIKVMLLSLKAGGLGLTLTSANRVYVFDPWWCPASEQQAVDRVHRLGQFRPVTVRRFIVNNTIEKRILQLQERKLLLARGAMASREEMRSFRLEELRLLFEM